MSLEFPFIRFNKRVSFKTWQTCSIIQKRTKALKQKRKKKQEIKIQKA